MTRYDFICQRMFWRTIFNLFLLKVVFLGGLRLHLTLVSSSISELLKAPLLSLEEVLVCCFEYRADLLGVTSSPHEHGNQGSFRVLFYLFAEYILFYKRYFFLLLLLRCILGLFHLLFSFFNLLSFVPLCVSQGKNNMRGFFNFSVMIIFISLVFLLLATFLSFLIHYLFDIK
jgi:hypothetical protein